MKPKLTIVIHPSGGKERSLTVEDAMGQVLDVVSLIEGQNEERNVDRSVRWVLVGATTNSPLTVQISAEGDPNTAEIWALSATDGIEDVARTLQILTEDKMVPDWMPGKSLRTAKRIFKRNLNGISVTEIRSDSGPSFFLDYKRSESALAAIEKFSSPALRIGRHRAKGEITGYLVKAGDYYGNAAFWVRDRRGVEVACVMEDDLKGVVGDATKLIDVWRNQRINVSGIKHFDDVGKLLKIVLTVKPKAAPLERVNLDRIIDSDFTGGKSPEDHIGGLRGDWGDNG